MVEGETKFRLQCCIDKMKNPINIFVSTKANSIESQVFYKNSDNKNIELCQNQENIIDLKKVILFKSICNLLI